MIRKVTIKTAPCSYCGRTIPGGEGRIYRCGAPDRSCAAPAECNGGWHAMCLDGGTCRKRAGLTQDQRARLDEVAAGLEADGETDRSTAEDQALKIVLSEKH